MNRWSVPPADDELEVSVFGRGVGEAVVAHLGHRRWIAVDSCLDEQAEPVSLTYLKRLGLSPSEVLKLVAVSHWDSDHVGGLATLFRVATSAAFACASTLHDPELVAAIRTRGRVHEPEGDRRNVDQFAGVFAELARRRHGAIWGLRGTVLWEQDDLRVWSLSPAGRAHVRALTRLVESARSGHVPAPQRNPLSMVVWVDVGRHRILLGGDLENHPTWAWHGVINSPGRRGGRGAVYKVPHHGSVTAHVDDVWTEMLIAGAPAVVTSYSRSHLPTGAGLAELRRKTKRLFLAGAAITPSERREDDRRLIARATASGGLETLTGRLGQVRLRAPIAEPSEWSSECFGNARQV